MQRKAVLLIRVSDHRQEKEGLSLDNQEEVLRHYAAEHDFEIVKEFRFQESADQKIRKRFMEMVNFIKRRKDVSVIISYRVDRLTRNYRDHVLIDDLRSEHDKEFHCVYDRLVIGKRTVGRDIQDWDTKVYLAKQFLNRLKEDAIISARYKLERGEWIGKAPYGYRNRKNERGRSWIYVVPFEAKVVIKILTWYASGAHSMLDIRRKLNEELGLSFSVGKLDGIIKNRFYCGEMLYVGKYYPHFYEQIVPPEICDQILQVKARFNKQPHKFVGLPFLYRGLIRCATCYCAITPERKHKKGKTYHYYHCTQYFGKHNAARLREADLTEQFQTLFMGLRIPTEELNSIVQTLKQSHQDKSAFADQLRTQLQGDWQRYEHRIRAMYEDKLDGLITAQDYTERTKEYRDKQKQIKSKLESLERAEETYYQTASYLLKIAGNAHELFAIANAEEKRLLLTTVLQDCVLKDEKLLWKVKKPFDVIFQHASRQAWRPLTDVFLNREVEFDCNLECVHALIERIDASDFATNNQVNNEPSKQRE